MKSLLQPDRYGDRDRDRSAQTSNNNTTAGLQSVAVPYVKDKYDPDHPDADWGGYVQRSYKKKAASNDHAATRQNLTVDERGGLMPDRDAPIVSASLSGKKLFDTSQQPAGDPNQQPGIQFQSAVYQVGPGGADLSCRSWKTSYEAQTSSEATPQDVYAVGTRQNTQHKRHVAPMYEKAVNPRGYGLRSSSSHDNNSNSNSPSSSRGSSPSGLVASDSSGSLSGRRMESRRSLLAGIGKLVATEDVRDSLGRPEHHLPQSFADSTAKVLLAANHHNITLGYTGRKSSFRR